MEKKMKKKEIKTWRKFKKSPKSAIPRETEAQVKKIEKRLTYDDLTTRDVI